MILYLLNGWFSRKIYNELFLNLDDTFGWNICWWKSEIYEAMFHLAFCAMPLQFRHLLRFIYDDSRMQFAYSPSNKKLLLFFPLILWGQIFWHATEVCMIIIFWRCHYWRTFIFHRYLYGYYICSHDNKPLVELEDRKRSKLKWGEMNFSITKICGKKYWAETYLFIFLKNKANENKNNLSEYLVLYSLQPNWINVIYFDIHYNL